MKKSTIWILVFLVIAISLFLYFKKENTANIGSTESKTFFGVGDYTQPTDPVVGESPERGAYATYTDPIYHFTFSYPQALKTTSFEEAPGYTVLVQDTANHAIQVYITPFDENITLTAERIKQDIPDIVMNNTKTVQVAGISAQTFNSTNEVFGTTREVWFVHEGNLYQIVTSPELEMTLAGILLSWKL